MSSDTTFCGAPDCVRPTTSGVLCNTCHDQLVTLVNSLPWDLTQLQTAATNQNRFTTGGGARSNETPLMFNPFASTALASLVATVHIWQARLAGHLNNPPTFTNPVKAAKWMAEHIDLARAFINAGQMLDALHYAHDHVEKVINKPPQRQFLGDCLTVDENGHTCPGRMYAYPDEHEARCDTCTREIDAQAQRLKLLRELDDKWLTAAEIARVATYMGLTIDRDQVRKRINQWSTRGHLERTKEGEPKFRFREARLMLERDEEKRVPA